MRFYSYAPVALHRIRWRRLSPSFRSLIDILHDHLYRVGHTVLCNAMDGEQNGGHAEVGLVVLSVDWSGAATGGGYRRSPYLCNAKTRSPGHWGTWRRDCNCLIQLKRLSTNEDREATLGVRLAWVGWAQCHCGVEVAAHPTPLNVSTVMSLCRKR